MNTRLIVMLVFLATVCMMNAGVGAADEVNVTFEGRFGGTGDAVAVSGNYAYIGQGQDFVVLDISTPDSPVELGRVMTSGIVRDIAVSDSYAYVVDWFNGLVIVDISNPAAPTLAGSYDTAGYAHGVTVEGSYAYIADYHYGLVIVDISNPAAPTLAGSYNTTECARGVTVKGSYAYVADLANGLVIVDISNPAAPTLAGSYDTAGYAQGVTVEGSYAYVANSNGLVIVDISNPAAPTLAGSYDTGYARGVTVEGSYAYVADSSNGLVIVDISNPAAPTLAGSYDTAVSACGVTVEGSYAYVADYSNGLVILRTDASGTDTTPPLITITSPTDGVTVTTSSITVTGMVSDDTGVTGVTVNGNPVTLETDGSFTTTVSLTSGVNIITVVATDAAGNSATETVTVTASLPNLVFAITPNSRLAQVGTPVTIFMSIINAGTGNATDVSISQASGLAATIGYQAWDGATLTGSPDTPVDIPAGEAVHFVLTINATAEFDSSPMTFDVSGTNAAAAPISSVNTLTVSASAVPYADIIMMSTSLDMGMTVDTPAAFAIATSNVGSAEATGVSLIVDVPIAITGLVCQVNETNPDGSIKGPAAGLTIPVDGQPTFAVFLTPTQAINYDPANNMIVLKLVDGSGKVVGAQSVAVSTA